MGRRSEQTFFLMTHTWQKNIWKDAQYHLSPEKYKSKPQRYPPHTIRMAIIKKIRNLRNKFWQEYGEKGRVLCNIGGDVNWCSHCGK